MLTILLALSPILLVANAGPVPDTALRARDTFRHQSRAPASISQTRDTVEKTSPHKNEPADSASDKSHDLAFETLNDTLQVVDKAEDATPADESQQHSSTLVFIPPERGPGAQSVGSVSPYSASTPIVAAYYPDWASDTVSPEDVDFNRFDWVDFAFAVPNANFGLDFDSPKSKVLLARLVTAAHAKKKFVKLSIGGWTGSAHFSQAVANEKSRTTFIHNIANFYTQYNLDGIDIDWEYPGDVGQTGNSVSPHDTANFLVFLQDLRSTLPETARLSAACQVWPFSDEAGNPETDVSAFASVLDWILIMNYDTWGSSSTPGSNAPLDDGCHNSSQPLVNARAAVATWTKAGFPASQIILGIPSYGYISQSSATNLRDKRSQEEPGQVSFDEKTKEVDINPPTKPDAHAKPQTQSAAAATTPVKVENDDGGTDGGQVQFRSLVQQGALKLSASGKYVGARGYKRFWDDCSSTPFLRSQSAQQVITYDDPESLKLKAAFAKEVGLLGVNMFDVHGDTEKWDLIDAARAGLGLH